MQKQFLKFAEGLGLNDFKVSQFWSLAKLKRNKKVGINLYGEANYMTYEQRGIIMSEWCKDFHSNIAEVYAPPE